MGGGQVGGDKDLWGGTPIFIFTPICTHMRTLTPTLKGPINSQLLFSFVCSFLCYQLTAFHLFFCPFVRSFIRYHFLRNRSKDFSALCLDVKGTKGIKSALIRFLAVTSSASSHPI